MCCLCYADGHLTVHQATDGETYAANTGFIICGPAYGSVKLTIGGNADAQTEYAGTFKCHRAAGTLAEQTGITTYTFIADKPCV